MFDIPGVEPALCRYVFENSSIILLLLDKEGRILDSNAYARGMICDDLSSMHIKDVIVDFTGSFDVTAINAETDRTFLLNVRTKSGLPQTLYFRFIQLNDSILAFGESNSMEIETLRLSLVEINNELSNLNRELQKKNAELDRLNNLKNEFLGMAAHDLRSPIGVIQSYSEFLLDETSEVLTDEHVGFLSTIRSLSQFMLEMLNNLLDITAIESGRLRLVLKSGSIEELVLDSVALNRVLADKKQIHIAVNVKEPPPGPVMMDSQKIKQVLDNLITNALKFSFQNTIVTVQVETEDDDVKVTVTDEGQGIPDADMAKLFRPFPKTTVRSTSGEKSTGLGLSIANKIIAAHQGRIGVRSEVSKGSSFYFTLPLGVR